jgi:hypothetical protein
MRGIPWMCLVVARLWAGDTVHFLRWPDAQPVVARLAAAHEKLPDFKEPEDFDNWIRERDAAIRGRVEHGIEDSISALILFGTSFRGPPRLAAATDAVNTAGNLIGNARARVDAFIQAVDQIDDERFRIVLEFLRRRRVTEEELPAFLSGNLRRYALEQAAVRKNPARPDAGLPLETSLLADFAIEDTLAALKASGALPGHIRRIAVVGPGLELAGDPGAADYAPPQSIQVFAVLEAVLRLGAAQANEIQLTALDLNSVVLSSLRSSLSKARSTQRYLLQLPRSTSAGWNNAVVSYWQRFGELIATPAATVTVTPPGIESRFVAVKAQIAACISVEDVNIVSQSIETAQGFDLVVATNILGSYNRVEQTLALANMARMMATGGILISNGVPAGSKTPEFQDLGTRRVTYTENGNSADELIIYRRQ